MWMIKGRGTTKVIIINKLFRLRRSINRKTKWIRLKSKRNTTTTRTTNTRGKRGWPYKMYEVREAV
jgi:hypothetical protein